MIPWTHVMNQWTHEPMNCHEPINLWLPNESNSLVVKCAKRFHISEQKIKNPRLVVGDTVRSRGQATSSGHFVIWFNQQYWCKSSVLSVYIYIYIYIYVYIYIYTYIYICIIIIIILIIYIYIYIYLYLYLFIYIYIYLFISDIVYYIVYLYIYYIVCIIYYMLFRTYIIY